ncbi:MAG: hypothetical protein VCD00_18800 [Candidatus Hydrogenedentota bacterium]
MHSSLIKVLFLLIVALVITIVGLRRFWNEPSKTRNLTRDLSISFFTTTFLLCTVEFFFATFMIQSDGFGFTLSSRKWFDTYWKPINDAGYRDYEHDWKENIVLVTGDSFAAGHGIKHIEQRFASHLNTHLGADWTVAVVAQNGWGPKEELEALREHTAKPNHIIVSYYPNDIHTAAEKHDLRSDSDTVPVTNPVLRPVVNRFYAANHLYWRMARRDQINSYWEFLEEAYNDPEIWDTHTDELQAIVDYAEEQDASVSFVLWPLLFDVSKTQPMTDKVARWMTDNQIPHLDLSQHLSDRRAASMVINTMDGHPNAELNKEVGQLIYDTLGPWEDTSTE